MYIGLFTFGGGYSMIPLIEEVAISKGWVENSEQLTNFIALSESTPGPFAINIATFIGEQNGGIFGALCATVGVILPSFVIILLLTIILNKVMNNRFVKGALKGVRPVVLALIAATAITLFVKIVLGNGFNLTYSNHDINFDRASLALLILLSLVSYLYKKAMKKSLNPLLILLLSGICGLIIFSV